MNDESRPAKAALADHGSSVIYPDSTLDRFTPLRISAVASRTIDRWVTMLAADEISLAALPIPLCSLYNLGVLHGRQSREDEVRAARLEADRLWLRSFGDEARREYLLNRLDRAAELANRPDVDDVLDEAWRTYLRSLDDVRNEVTA